MLDYGSRDWNPGGQHMVIGNDQNQAPRPASGASPGAIAAEQMATVVIFGATGDLAQRKLIPAIYHLWQAGFLPREMRVVGVARRAIPDDEFRDQMCEALKRYARQTQGQGAACDPFMGNVSYFQSAFDDTEGYRRLATYLDEMDAKDGRVGNRLFYLATAPEFFGDIVAQLGAANLIQPSGGPSYSRVVVEKPFGHDLASACALNSRLGEVLCEDQIYRIDHYLGKETVQNIFAFRFGNAIFEPLFNNRYVDHVQITVAESIGMEGRRGEFYDKVGAMRDVLQNHALQLLSLAAMEPPAAFTAKEVRDEKLKVLNGVRLPLDEPRERWVVRGQYVGANGRPGYQEEAGVAPDSRTETFVALKLCVNNWRWAGVPFFIRTGKSLAARVTEIAIEFRHPPTEYFVGLGVGKMDANVLVFRIQPEEAITLSFNAKPPGIAFGMGRVDMDFTYGESFDNDLPDAYEHLLLDALRGDSTLFARADEIESAWRICDEIRAHWGGDTPCETYPSGSWGPETTQRLMDGCGEGWRTPKG